MWRGDGCAKCLVARRMIRSGGGGSSTSVERAFKLADARSERLAAVIRIAIFAAIMVAVVAAQSTGFDHRPLEAAGASTEAVRSRVWRSRGAGSTVRGCRTGSSPSTF
jgi:hypothetical protein